MQRPQKPLLLRATQFASHKECTKNVEMKSKTSKLQLHVIASRPYIGLYYFRNCSCILFRVACVCYIPPRAVIACLFNVAIITRELSTLSNPPPLPQVLRSHLYTSHKSLHQHCKVDRRQKARNRYIGKIELQLTASLFCELRKPDNDESNC